MSLLVFTVLYCTSKELQANRGRFFLGVSKSNKNGDIYQELIQTFDLVQRIRLDRLSCRAALTSDQLDERSELSWRLEGDQGFPIAL